MKKPKTIEEWEVSIAQHKRGVVIIQRAMFNSKAFLELSKRPLHVLVLLAAINQVFYDKKGNTGKRAFANGGIIYLPQNLLKARGVNANATIAEAKKRLVELGFIDVVETGSVHHAGVFKISERWSKYPHGDYLPKDRKLPGTSLYSEYGFTSPEHPVTKKRHAKKTSVQ
jgi:hypothetical protein